MIVLPKMFFNGSTETCEETPLKIRSRILEYEMPFFCRVCTFHFSSFDVFISHLKSRQHKKELLLSVVPFYYIYNYPDNTCTLCEYPYYNDANRKLHLESDEHKAAATASVSHVTEAVGTLFYYHRTTDICKE
ncbi:hypothetical protein IGI04_029434 [Brassica rapa subsp. trilocularis]|uniref:C2H2-type domain-containing protein n=1 Tax=Brassica rapa subsp. trilocularis TaxID=1813537 RepID=A0ABQ7LMU5_BRACM|nr:hypothetical protein IGI04_029434 [Brassica rapa subsp. trilocularis]